MQLVVEHPNFTSLHNDFFDLFAFIPNEAEFCKVVTPKPRPRYQECDLLFEDNPYHWRVMVAADRVAVVDQKLFYHRRSRSVQEGECDRSTPRTSHLAPHTAHLAPRISHLTPHTSYLIPHLSYLAPPTSPTCASQERRRSAASGSPRGSSLSWFITALF